jgi:Zn-dependent protease
VQALDLSVFLYKISYWTIPVLFAITLHEVAHGWMARYFGDRTAEMLGRLSLNPLRHIDPVGTVLVPGILLAMSGMLFGWAKPVPVATKALRKPRLPGFWWRSPGRSRTSSWRLVVRRARGHRARQRQRDADRWIASMAQAGIVINVILALFNLLPIPPLDGGRVLTGLLPSQWGARMEKFEPIGLFLVVGLSVLGLLGWLFDPAMHTIGRVITM